jgi:hypothetical protein
MKKQLSIVLAIIVVAAIGVSAWFYGYYNRKSNDNLPALTAIAEMSESDINSLLPGYEINQLREVWGDPDYSEDGTDKWIIGNTSLIVNYKNNGVVAICGLKDDNGTSIEMTEGLSEIPGGTRFIIEIRDRTEYEQLECAEATELFYEDETTYYWFNVIKSHYIIVTYNNGNSEDIITALNTGRATITDLDEFGIEYHTEPKK